MSIEDISRILPMRDDGTEIGHLDFSSLSNKLWSKKIPVTFTLDYISRNGEWDKQLSVLCSEDPLIFFYDCNYYTREKRGNDHATVITNFKPRNVVGNDPLDNGILGYNTRYDYDKFIYAWVSKGCKVVKPRRYPEKVLGLRGKKKQETLEIDKYKQKTLVDI